MKGINAKIIWYLLMGIVGAVLIVFNMCGMLDEFYSGLGFGLVVLSVLRGVQIAVYMKNPKYAEKMNIEISDERNIYLAHRARSAAFIWGVLLCAVLTVVFRIINQKEISTLLGLLICIFLIIYYVAYYVLKLKN